jgi:cephalosporin hydroxylase
MMSEMGMNAPLNEDISYDPTPQIYEQRMTTVNNPPHWTIGPGPGWDLAASIEAFDRQIDMPAGIKCKADMDRYQKIIEDTKPDLLIECGTWQGGSARWFAQFVPHVLTIDIDNQNVEEKNITFARGDSGDPAWVDLLEPEGRVMVSLDSNHTPAHVAKELAIWPRFVTPGCYLVVEDTLLHYKPCEDPKYDLMDPLVAVWDFLETEEGRRFEVDKSIENMFAVSEHPDGWLRCIK